MGAHVGKEKSSNQQTWECLHGGEMLRLVYKTPKGKGGTSRVTKERFHLSPEKHVAKVREAAIHENEIPVISGDSDQLY